MTTLKNFIAGIGIYAVPVISIMAMVLVFYIPRFTEFWNYLRLAPFYAGIYFWLSQRPDAFNGFSAFILGIFADVISASPLGVNIMGFLVLYFLASRFSNNFNIKKFSYSWLLFAIAAFISMLFNALIVSAFYRAFVPLNLLVFEYLLTITLYPILARFYIWVEERCIHLEEQYEKI